MPILIRLVLLRIGRLLIQLGATFVFRANKKELEKITLDNMMYGTSTHKFGDNGLVEHIPVEKI